MAQPSIILYAFVVLVISGLTTAYCQTDKLLDSLEEAIDTGMLFLLVCMLVINAVSRRFLRCDDTSYWMKQARMTLLLSLWAIAKIAGPGLN